MALTTLLPLPNAPAAPQQEDDDHTIQGLTAKQIEILAQKVYDLLLEETRIEKDRQGSGHFTQGH